MGLYVSTTGTDVSIPELGFTLTDPSTDYALSDQFSDEELARAPSLTDAIRAGTLIWKKTSGGSAQPATDYDPDYLEIENMNTGPGLQADRAVTFKDLAAISAPKAGMVLNTAFIGTPKTAAVVFGTAFPDNNYAVLISGTDIRAWSAESKTASGFTINANADQALTGYVYWSAEYQAS